MVHAIENDQLTIKLEENLVATNASKMLAEIKAIIEDVENIHQVIADITKVDVMDSLGVNLLVGVYKQCSEQNWTFRVAGASPSILRLFSLYKLTSYFGIVE